MEKGIKKISYKVLTLVLCLCIVSGAVAPAYATSTTSDGSAHNLWDLYWTTSSNPSGKNGSWYGVVRILLKDIFDKIELLQTDQRNLWTYNSTSYRLKNFTDTTSFSESYYISSGAYPMSWLLNSMANLSQNTGYTANQFYNLNSNLNQAMSAMVSLNQNFKDYTTVLNNIKTDTSNLLGIKIDTANLSGIKTDTANLFGIKTDTANLSGIKTDTANLLGIKTDIETFNNDYNNINWIYYNGYAGLKTDTSSNYVSSATSNTEWYLYFYPNSNINVYKIHVPLIVYATRPYELIIDFKFLNPNGTVYDVSDFIISYDFGNNGCDLIINIPLETYYIASPSIIYIKSNYALRYTSASGSTFYIDNNSKDYFELSNFNVFRNLYIYFKQAKEVFFDDKTIAAKKANQAQEDSVLSNFTGSGAASASVSDFGAVKDSMVDFKAGFNGGASSSDTFSFLSGGSNAWNWFTQDTANDVDRTQRSNTRLLRGSSDVASDTPLLDSYYTDILSILGGDQ